MALRPAVFDRQILSLDVAGFAQSLAERGDKRCSRRAGRPGVEDADHRRRLLLRARCERPCRHRAGEKNYEIASPHARPLALTASRTNVNWNSPDAQPDSCTRTIRATTYTADTFDSDAIDLAQHQEPF